MILVTVKKTIIFVFFKIFKKESLNYEIRESIFVIKQEDPLFQ